MDSYNHSYIVMKQMYICINTLYICQCMSIHLSIPNCIHIYKEFVDPAITSYPVNTPPHRPSPPPPPLSLINLFCLYIQFSLFWAASSGSAGQKNERALIFVLLTVKCDSVLLILCRGRGAKQWRARFTFTNV